MTNGAAGNAPRLVKQSDAKCREDNEISNQPRPAGTGLVVEPAHRVQRP
jgi:hypothetical protein